MSNEIGFDLLFPAQYLRQALAVSLLSVWVLVGLFFYLNHYTKRRYFTIWAAGWLFYALWLTLNFSLGYPADRPLVGLLKQCSISTVALFLFWGSARFLGQRVNQVVFGLFALFLYVWSYYGAYHLDDPLQARLPVFGLIAVASLRVAYCFYIYRTHRPYIGAGLLAFGFVLWAVFHVVFPFIYRAPELIGAGFFAAAVLQLFIAVSMIVLVLEEARQTHNLAFRNLTLQVREKSRLRFQAASSEERFKNLFESAGEGIIITDIVDFRVLEINLTACRFLGLEPEQVRGKSLFEFLPVKPPAGTTDLILWLANLRPLYFKQTDGGLLPVEASGSAVPFDGQVAAQFFFREMSERTKLEQQLRQTEKLAALGQMISKIAHELNNPLTVVKGYTEMILANRVLDPQVRNELEKVAHESNRAAKLVNNFLTFARERPIQRELVNLNQVVERVLDLRKFAVQIAGVRIETVLDPALPATLADADQMQQVLVILINNAVQAMAGQSATGILRLTSSATPDNITIRVQDNGPGIPVEIEQKIFEPFFSTKEVGSGTGLGLSIAHSLMVENQGRIYLERPAGRGACFVIELPVSRAAGAIRAANLARAALPAASAPRLRLQALVLDDEKMIADLLVATLTILGCTAVCCQSPLRALELVRQRKFDVILSDIRMPEMNGNQFYAAVREFDPGQARRIVFLTGDTVNEETRQFFDSIPNAHLGKPFQREALEEILAGMAAMGTIEPVRAEV